jgi:hypothetical protein
VRRTAWTIRVAFLLVSALLLVAAVQVRRDSEATVPELARLSGVTGQRQPISFQVNHDGQPEAFATTLWSQCPGDEYRTNWAPADGAPVRFRWTGRWMTVREESSFTYEDGVHGSVVSGMTAEARNGRIEGFARSVWRFERDGTEYMACDSGFVPFAAGPHAGSRVERMAEVRDPVTLYPIAPKRPRPESFAQARFVLRTDATCLRAYWPVRRARTRRAYVRAHAAQLAALLRLGQPPEARSIYRRWLRNFDIRIDLERRQLRLQRRGDLAAAASLAARIATLKAQGNAAGIAFGLRSCTANGPTGAPKS